MRLPGAVTGLAALALLLTACTGSPADDGAASAGPTTAAPAPSGADLLTASALPGDEALSPPPPDPAAAGHLAALAGVPSGSLEGTVELAVSGLVAFTEPVTGECDTSATGSVLTVALSDGSTLGVAFDGDGGSARLSAPGVDAGHALTDVALEVGTAVELSATLLSEGTTERAGSLAMAVTCA